MAARVGRVAAVFTRALCEFPTTANTRVTFSARVTDASQRRAAISFSRVRITRRVTPLLLSGRRVFANKSNLHRRRGIDIFRTDRPRAHVYGVLIGPLPGRVGRPYDDGCTRTMSAPDGATATPKSPCNSCVASRRLVTTRATCGRVRSKRPSVCSLGFPRARGVHARRRSGRSGRQAGRWGQAGKYSRTRRERKKKRKMSRLGGSHRSTGTRGRTRFELTRSGVVGACLSFGRQQARRYQRARFDDGRAVFVVDDIVLQ